MSQREISFVPEQPSKALLPLAQRKKHHVVISLSLWLSIHMEREREDLPLQDEAVAT